MTPRLTRRRFMGTTALAAAGAMLPLLPLMPKGAKAQMTAEPVDLESLPPLREVAAKKGILYGAAVGTPNLKKDARFREAVIRECNVIVPEYEGKWKTLMPEARGAWHYDRLDELVLFAEEHGMKLRGHTLIWHGSFPDWAKEALKEGQGPSLMEEYIQAAVSRYKGRIFSWDVVNEAIQPKDGLEGGLRKTPWLEAMGPEYIERAFRLAHEADPTAQLVYNEYGMDYGEDRAKATLALVRRLMDKGVPVHAVGLQAHVNIRQKFGPLETFCKDVKAMGLKLLITEFDVWDADDIFGDGRRDREVADKAKEFLDIAFAHAKPEQFLTWGLSDKYSWLSSPQWNKQNNIGTHARGLPLDDECKRKVMWGVLSESLSNI